MARLGVRDGCGVKVMGILTSTRLLVGNSRARSFFGLAAIGLGAILFVSGWVLAFSALGQFLLLPGLFLCVVGGWLIGGWKAALAAPIAIVVFAIALLLLTNVTLNAWDRTRNADSHAFQTPRPPT